MIPKVINYCWFGGNPKPKEIIDCINSWKKICPDYEIIEWNESNFDISINSYVKEAYDNKKWAFVSDYARLWIIYKYGGIYLDTDVKLIKNIDDILEYELFLCSEDNEHIATGLGFGAKPNNKYVKKMLDDYNNVHFIYDGKMDLTPCPVRNTESLKLFLNNIKDKSLKQIVDNCVYFPKEFFNPKNPITGDFDITENTYGIHLYLGTWVKPSKKILFKIKQFIKKHIFYWR